MNTSRAVLYGPQTFPTSSLLSPVGAYKILVASILMMSTPIVQSEEVSDHPPVIVQTIPWEELSQLFEGFTPKLKYDPKRKTWNIGYGTDIGKKKSTWPYGTYAQDVAELLKKEGLSDATIRNIFQGSETISDDLGKKLFEMRYDRRKAMLTAKYEELFQKKFTDLPEVVQNMLVDFSYNMRGEYGIFPVDGFSGFPEACKALQREDWAAFAHEIAESPYANQVGPRRAGYWVYQLTQLSEKPLEKMTTDVKQEVKSYETVKPEIEARIQMILAHNNPENRR